MALPKVRRSIVGIDKLLNSEYNPRNISNDALSALKSSIEKFGLVQEIVVNERNNKIVGGHQRIKAMRAAGVTKANVAYVDLNEHDEKALNIALNSPHLMGTFTDELHDLMDELQAGEYPDFDELRFDDFGSDNVSHIDTYEKEKVASAPDELDGEYYEPEEEDEEIEENHMELIGDATLLCGDCVTLMGEMEDSSVDSIVTDPPYGIGFMGKEWDQDVPGDAWAAECLRILKPGGHIIAFAATRTVHRLAIALEDAGFEIRDQIAWIQWQGFPKSMQIESMPGWGTALKPSQEPAMLARKPLEGTVAQNVTKWGTGGLNIDGCRIVESDPAWPGPRTGESQDRWPANIYHCPKPARSEKEEGCEDLKGTTGHEATGRKKDSKGLKNPRAGAGRTAEHVKNYHPTVKPINLMRWLVRLVTPKNGVVLDTFLGSGTTCIAAQREGIRSIGMEKSTEYAKIARARIRKAKGNE
jgi:DNA modification methylase